MKNYWTYHHGTFCLWLFNEYEWRWWKRQWFTSVEFTCTHCTTLEGVFFTNLFVNVEIQLHGNRIDTSSSHFQAIENWMNDEIKKDVSLLYSLHWWFHIVRSVFIYDLDILIGMSRCLATIAKWNFPTKLIRLFYSVVNRKIYKFIRITLEIGRQLINSSTYCYHSF